MADEMSEWQRYMETNHLITQERIEQERKAFCDSWLDNRKLLWHYQSLYVNLANAIKKNDLYGACALILEEENDD